MAKHLVQAKFQARIDQEAHIYDGDTINHVFFRLPIEVKENQEKYGEVYPEVFVQQDGVWIHINVRISGIDTPELHPHHRYPDGTMRPVEEIAHEHELALKAREIVVNLLKANSFQFEIRDPQEGKYAGRIVAEVWVKNPKTGQMINIADKLIREGLGYVYEGGTKMIWGKQGS